MADHQRQQLNQWDRIQPAPAILKPPIEVILFRRKLMTALEGECCGDLCQNPARLIIQERPAVVVLDTGAKIAIPDDALEAEEALESLGLSTEQVHFLINNRRSAKLCLSCLEKRLDKEY